MMFTFLLTAGVCHTFGLRPEIGTSRATSIAKLGDKVTGAASSDASSRVELLKASAGIVQSIVLENGNATEHMSDDDEALLNSVVDLIRDSIYTSMTSSHNADINATKKGLKAVDTCNDEYSDRIGETGDLFEILAHTKEYQTTLDNLQENVDVKTTDNVTKWTALLNHMKMIGVSPKCAPAPSGIKKEVWDIFFEDSPYVAWYVGQQALYVPVRNAYEAADAALTAALTAYAVGLAERDTSYCILKEELEAGCDGLSTCFQREAQKYTDLKAELTDDMQKRIDAYKAGETIIAQIKFLLGDSTDSAPPTDIDVSPYVLTFPALPEKVSCNLGELDSPIWVPSVDCSPPQPYLAACENPNHSTLPGCTLPKQGTCIGVVRLGWKDRWSTWQARNGVFTCSNSAFGGDPWGGQAKECWCDPEPVVLGQPAFGESLVQGPV